MNKCILFFICLLLSITTTTNIFAQEAERHLGCFSAKGRNADKNTIADPAENNYDIKYVKLNLNMTNTATTVSGNSITKAVVLSSSLSQYVFELLNVLTIDSVLINGINCVVTTSGDVRTANILAPISSGSLFTAQVFYHGTPPSGGLYSALGINTLISPSLGASVTFTLSESYHAKEWWPCKQSLKDKIDSADIWITVADSLKAGSNGTLKAITTIDSNHVRYEWKESNPIDYYLISASVANYIDYSYYMHFTGSTDSMLVQNYIYRNPLTLPSCKSVIDSTGMMIDYFSTLYGRYPFWHEKYGHCMAPLSGGMEHQTMTTCGYFDGMVVSHELAHQWFGDNATCGTWSDIFMNEGFASYSEDLFYDHFRSHAAMTTDILNKQTDVLYYDTGTVYCIDTTSENRIFDYRLSYEKGACVLHMLRFVVANDSVFFAVLRSYQQQYTGSIGIITDLKNKFESILGTTFNGINNDTFFNQWYYLQGYPKYTVSWNQTAGSVVLKIVQAGAVPASVTMFTLPIEITFHSSTIDTTVRILNNADTQYFYFPWSNIMTGLTFDPNHWLLHKIGTINHDLTLDAPITSNYSKSQIVIAPNPSNAQWHITNILINSTLQLRDISGRQIWSITNTQNSTAIIPASELTKGIYLLEIKDADRITNNYKLIKY